MKVLELFSGIGGMHMAAQIAAKHLEDIEIDVVAAVDINTVSNDVYRHNNPNTKVWQRNITGLSVPELAKLGVEIVLMSPPCQPHTRQGRKLDTQARIRVALHYLICFLPQVSTIRYILLENVSGFETSQAREEVVTVLSEAGFSLQEFLVCPRQLGIPNSRLRYYMLAKRGTEDWSFTKSPEIIKNFTPLDENIKHLSSCMVTSDTLQTFMDLDVKDEFLVPDSTLEKHSHVLDLVTKDSGQSCCFTSAYSRYCEGTGSVIHQEGNAGDIYDLAKDLKSSGNSTQAVEELKKLRLRFFTPAEVARLLGFPSTFSFPINATKKQQYKVLGNSINVTVVGLLIYSLLK